MRGLEGKLVDSGIKVGIVITRGDAAYAGSDSSMASNSTSGIIRFFKEMTPFICFTS